MARLSIEVIYATRQGQEIVRVGLEDGARAIDAVRESGFAVRHPEVMRDALSLGVFGQRVAPDTLLKDGDRVEIYRPLKIDPKAARRAKASAGRRLKNR